ncbi:hypothetical protein [Paracnuella aquatica]|uniref:hypothetical protein n=1 Tax=Paracnuella aquatica TaxID=2268757 RepID=UPI000DEFF07E|nr:hypothetical protein [Paracnuella aquatica]RPD50652.1 hypothetical protein DRJ53_06950 [Paracnuella aquatica]
MASKENKGGMLRNEDIERELERTGANDLKGGQLRGAQDTGDDVVREQGTPVQRQDGAGEESDE